MNYDDIELIDPMIWMIISEYISTAKNFTSVFLLNSSIYNYIKRCQIFNKWDKTVPWTVRIFGINPSLNSSLDSDQYEYCDWRPLKWLDRAYVADDGYVCCNEYCDRGSCCEFKRDYGEETNSIEWISDDEFIVSDFYQCEFIELVKKTKESKQKKYILDKKKGKKKIKTKKKIKGKKENSIRGMKYYNLLLYKQR